ncbi:hypothetical protein N9X77_06490 [Luminiphilus sp.]|nr:hypothetical protein [Luminiphilus sp.]
MAELYVLTAVINPGKSLHATLSSLYAQSTHRFRHFILDGGSTDDWEHEHDFSKYRNTVLVKKEDGGLYEGLNNAVACVPDGHAFMYLHAGDILVDSAYIEKTLACLRLPDPPNLIYSDITFHDESGTIVRNFQAGSFNQKSLRRGWCPPHTSVVVLKAYYSAVGPHDTSYRISGDYEWLLRALMRDPKIHYLRTTSVSMLTGGLSSSRSLLSALTKLKEDYRAAKLHFNWPVKVVVLKRLRKLNQWRIF